MQTFFHHDTEPSLVDGRAVFHHLTKGFVVLDDAGEARCRLVDDVTIRNDLESTAPPAGPEWYRVLSDEPRLLRLIDRLADPLAPADAVLDPVAEAFGTEVERRPDGRYRLDDRGGATVAMVTPQGGERERACELITPPIDRDHRTRLEALLAPARRLGFVVPDEAAVHIHLDAAPFRSAAGVAALVEMFATDRDDLWRTIGTNPRCRRLAPLPAELVEAVGSPGFSARPWPEVLELLRSLPLTKYSDCNLVNLRDATIGKDTVEMRILPGAADADSILDGVAELRRRLPTLA